MTCLALRFFRTAFVLRLVFAWVLRGNFLAHSVPSGCPVKGVQTVIRGHCSSKCSEDRFEH